MRDTIEEVLGTGDMIEKVEFLKDGVPDPKLAKHIRKDPHRYTKLLRLTNPVIEYGVSELRAQELTDIVLGLYYYGPLQGEPFDPINFKDLTFPEQNLVKDALEYCSLD